MLRILIVLAAFVWLGLMLSGTGKDRLRPGLETARKSGTPIIEIDPLHRTPLRAGDSGPATAALPEAAPKLAAVAGGEAQVTPADTRTGNGAIAGNGGETGAIPQRKRRVAPVFTLSDLPPAGQVEVIPGSPADTDGGNDTESRDGPTFATDADSPFDARAEGTGAEGTGAEDAPAEFGAEPLPGSGDFSGDFTVTADALNLRDAPSTGGGVIFRLERGDSVQVIGDSGTGWAEVLAGDGALRGYVSARFLAPAP